MFIKKKMIWNLKESSITSESVFNSRRNIIKNLAIGSLVVPSASLIPFTAFSSFYPPMTNNFYKVDRGLTKESLATTYTNFYEFGSSKNIWRRAVSYTHLTLPTSDLV